MGIHVKDVEMLGTLIWMFHGYLNIPWLIDVQMSHVWGSNVQAPFHTFGFVFQYSLWNFTQYIFNSHSSSSHTSNTYVPQNWIDSVRTSFVLSGQGCGIFLALASRTTELCQSGASQPKWTRTRVAFSGFKLGSCRP